MLSIRHSFLHLALISLLTTSLLRAEWTPGYAAIDSFSGNVNINGNSGVPVKHHAFQPDGVTLSTNRDGFLAVVFSNGMSIYMGPSSQLKVIEFAQQPWHPEESNPDFEPSRSKINIQLIEGEFAITQRQAFPTSEILFTVPQGTIETISPALFVQLGPTEASLFVLDGRAIFSPTSQNRRDFVQFGQRLNLNQARQVDSGIALDRIGHEQNKMIEELLTRSRLAAARTVFIIDGNVLGARAVRPVHFFERRAAYDPMIR